MNRISPVIDDGFDLAQLRSDLRRDGYVVLHGFLQGDEVQQLHREVARLIREVVPTMPRDDVNCEIRERPETLKQLHRLHNHDAFFADLYAGGRFERLAEAFLGEAVVGHGFQYFSKPPGTGKPTPPHQDGYYARMKPCEGVTMWLALDNVDQGNGCVRYVRGSHRGGMREHHGSGVLGFSQSLLEYGSPADVANEVPMPAMPGDLLVHHALTIHLADGNMSKSRQRRSLGLVYYAASSREDTAARQAYMEKLRQQLLEAGRI